MVSDQRANMKKRNQFLKYKLNQKEGDEGENEGGGGGGEDQAEIIADLQSQMTKIQAKNDELLGEAKKAKKAKTAAEDLAKTSSEDALKKAGDFEALYKSSQNENEKLKLDFDGLKSGIATEKRNSAALKMAGELADGANVELLSSFIGQRLRVTDEGVKVTDINGDLTVSSVDDLKKEFQGNDKYASLLKGNQSSGGGAAGNNNGGGAANELSTEEILTKSPQERAAYYAKQRSQNKI